MPSFYQKKMKNGTTRYRAVVRVSGYPNQSATFDKMADAKKWASKLDADMRLGKILPDQVADNHTVEEMIDRYLMEMKASQKNKKSFLENKEAQLLWWKNEIGHYRKSMVTESVISDCKHKLLTSGKKGNRSPATVNRYMSSLSHPFKIATDEWRWGKNNPFEKVKKLKEPRGIVRFLTEKELKNLILACRREKKPLELIVVLAISTGARKQEILSLHWKYVDMEAGRIILEDTKNGERRQLFLAGEAKRLMQLWYERKPKLVDLVFPSGTRKLPMVIDREWYRAKRVAGITDFRFHDLRHTAASYLAMNGATTAEIAEVLGHKTLNMVKRYAHLADSHTADVVTRMNDNIFKKEDC